MKSILQQIFEASGKPSDIKKFVQKSEKKKVRFTTGDIYDPYDSGYYSDFSYYSAKGHGYIKDKEGNVYNVEVMEYTRDAGRIAGGATHYVTKILKANGKDDFIVNGYVAIMCDSTFQYCIADIRAGYYLEDYIAKYIEYGQEKEFGEIAKRGDKNAKSYEDNKQEKKAQKYNDFRTRYFFIPNAVNWEISDNGLEITRWEPAEGSPEVKALRDQAKKEWEENKAPETYEKLKKEADENATKINTIVLDIFKPIVTDMLLKVFKTKDISKFKGLGGRIVYDYDWGQIRKGVQGEHVLVVDTKEKKIAKAIWVRGYAKIIDHKLELQVADNIRIDKSKLTPEVEKLIRKVAKAWKNTEGRKQGEYVEKNWSLIQRSHGGYYRMKDGAAKAAAKEEYKKIVMAHDFDKSDDLEFSLALIQSYIEGDLTPGEGPVEKPLENPEPSGEKKERGKNAKMSDKAYQAAKQKMQDWHDGKRKQNVTNCSDAKLKMNYKVCKELGLNKEMAELKKEADKRNINIEESLSLSQYVALFENL